MKQTKWLVLALLVALIAVVGCDRKVEGELKSEPVDSDQCFQCHNGFLDQDQGEWLASTHASGNNIDYTNRGGSDCLACHNQQGFIEFLNTGVIPETDLPVVSAIGCFACHNPHENGDLSLRTAQPYTFLNGEVYDHGFGNLCVHCHHQREYTGDQITDNYVVTSSRFGPHHGPQGEMIIGTGGYEGFPGFSYESSMHEALENTCTFCHMANERVHDGYKVGGHSFAIIDEESGTELNNVCQPCHDQADEIDFLIVRNNGADTLDFDNDGVAEGFQTEIAGLLDSLHVLLEAEGLITSSGSTVVQTIADANMAGAVFNYKYVEEDQSHGAHDFKYVVALLEASIAYVEANGVGAPALAGPVSQR
jgi:hypothetical protein